MKNVQYGVFLFRYALTEEDKNKIEHGEPVQDINQKTEMSYLHEQEARFTTFVSIDCFKNIIGRTYKEFIGEDGTGYWEEIILYTVECIYDIKTIGMDFNWFGGTSGGSGDPGESGALVDQAEVEV